ncbi:MAG: hypothetical protein HQL08_08385 [Nitrospirae bacterium]|nr:hypothetical protein [Nitrospirota bacterium]
MMKEMEAVSNFCGMTAALLFIVANAYYPARLIAKKFKPWSQDTVLFFRQYLKAHITLNLLALLALILHGHYAEERNIFLTLSFIASVALTIEGMLMHYRVVPGMQRHLRLLHTQQALFTIWIVLIIAGHAVI